MNRVLSIYASPSPRTLNMTKNWKCRNYKLYHILILENVAIFSPVPRRVRLGLRQLPAVRPVPPAPPGRPPGPPAAPDAALPAPLPGSLRHHRCHPRRAAGIQASTDNTPCAGTPAPKPL